MQLEVDFLVDEEALVSRFDELLAIELSEEV